MQSTAQIPTSWISISSRPRFTSWQSLLVIQQHHDVIESLLITLRSQAVQCSFVLPI